MQMALFVTGVLWMVAANAVAERAAQGFATRLNLPLLDAPLEQLFLVALLAGGFAALNWLGDRRGGVRRSNALPQRATSAEEFLRGLALGWGMVLVALLPLVPFGSLGQSYAWSLPLAGRTLVSVLTLALFALAVELAFRGYLYQRLIAATGTVAATFLMSLFYAFVVTARPNATAFTFVVSFLFGLFFCVAWQRTHALWLGWGLHAAWMISAGVVFGLPVGGYDNFATVVQGATGGPVLFAGGAFGLEGSLLGAIVVCLALPLLYRITRGYAWDYTHPEIVPAGFPMDVAPPPAHAAMEAKAAPLVQIAAITPAAPSTLPEANDLLRRAREPQDGTLPD